MARMLIPTRNRPTALSNTLGFIADFFPGTRIIVADGSYDDFKPQNAQTVKDLGDRIELDYRPYPDKMGLFERLLDVIRSIDDEYIIMGADDDFPMLDTLAKFEKFLDNNPDYVTALGPLISLKLESETELTARLDIIRPMRMDCPLKRARAFSNWPFPTTYAVTRRELLIARYERASEIFLSGFFDFTVGVQDCMHGKIAAFPDVGFFSTRNYNHSYLRPDDKLLVLRRSDDILWAVDNMVTDLINIGGIERQTAEDAAANIIRKRIAALSGAHPRKMRTRPVSKVVNTPIVQNQYKLFREMFEDGNETRERYKKRLDAIMRALKSNAQSDDNAMEARFQETMEKQTGTA